MFKSTDENPLVSVIVPSRNSEHTIADCLRSISSQSYNPIEIIVVDSLSTDSTRQLARTAGARVITHEGERSSAKNLGAESARGEYLYFVDADHWLDPGTIGSCVKSIGGADAVLVCDQDTIGDSRISQLVASRRRILSYDSLNVAARFVKKDVFDRLGGFDIDLYVGEDLDFHKRLVLHGCKIAFCDATEWHLGSPADLKGLWDRSLYYSSNYLVYVARNPEIAVRRLNPFREVQAWKKSFTRSSDLLPVILLGLLSDVFLAAGLLVSLGGRRLGRKDRKTP